MAQRLGVVAGGGGPDRVLLADGVGARPHRDRPVRRRLLRLQVLDRPRRRVDLRGCRCSRWRRRALPPPSPRWSQARPLCWSCPWSVPHAATGTPPLPELSSPHEASSRLARGWRSTPRVGLLACGSTPHGRLPGSIASRWHDGRRLPAHSCATAPDSHRLPVTRSVIQLWPSSMRRVPRGSSRGRWVHLEAMRQAGSRAVAVISVHASPLSDLGSGENGGMNLAIRRLCEGLSLRGVPTDVFVRRDGPGPDEELIAPLSRLVRLPVGPAAARSARRRCASSSTISPMRPSRHAASERRSYRAIHGHYWHGGLVGRRLREAWDVAWVQSFHTLALTKARAGLPLDALRAQAEGELAAQADRLVAASVAEAKDLIRLYHASRDRICVAQPGVDPRLFARARRLRAAPHPRPRRRTGRAVRRAARAAQGRADPARRGGAPPHATPSSPTSPWSSPVTTAVTARATTTAVNGAASNATLRASASRITSGSSARCRTSELADVLRHGGRVRRPVADRELRARRAGGAGARDPGRRRVGRRSARGRRGRGDRLPGRGPRARGLRPRDRRRPRGPGSQGGDGRGGAASRRTLHLAACGRPPCRDLRPAQRRAASRPGARAATRTKRPLRS